MASARIKRFVINAVKESNIFIYLIVVINYMGVTGSMATYDDIANAPREVKAIAEIVRQKPLIRNEILKSGVSEEQLQRALATRYVLTWDACVDEPLFYVEGFPSEWKTEEYVRKWVDEHNYTGVLLEVIKNRNKFGRKLFTNMLEFLQSYDTGKVKYWTPMAFYATLNGLYDSGELNQFENLRELLPLVEEARHVPIEKEDIDIVNGQVLVRLGMLSPVNKELGIYKHSFCNFLESYLTNHEIAIDSLITGNIDMKKLKKKEKEFLIKEADMIDEEGNLTPNGKIAVEYLCQCSLDLRDPEKAVDVLAEKWQEMANKQTIPTERARYMIKVAKMRKRSMRRTPEEDIEKRRQYEQVIRNVYSEIKRSVKINDGFTADAWRSVSQLAKVEGVDEFVVRSNLVKLLHSRSDQEDIL